MLIEKLIISMEAETLHDLRVELKRVRFIKNILATHYKTNTLAKAYKPFKKLFKKLGELRGQHVNLYRLAATLKNNADTAARKHFEQKRQKLETKIKLGLELRKERLASGMHTLKKLVANLPEWNEKSYLKQLKKQAIRKVNKHTPTQELHKARHLLKAVVYSAELSDSTALNIGRTFNMTVVANLEDAIGDWHDLSLLLKGKTGQMLTRKAEVQIKQKRKAELKRIRKLIPNLTKPIEQP